MAGQQLHPLRPASGAALAKALLDLGYLVRLVWPVLSEAGNDPLRRAILKEAEVQGKGLRLGAVGSRILAEVFVGLLQMSAERRDSSGRLWFPLDRLANRQGFVIDTGQVTGQSTANCGATSCTSEAQLKITLTPRR